MKPYAVLMMLMACAGMALAQPNLCTQDTVVGTYALAYQGVILMSVAGATQPVPAAGLSLLAIDSTGAITSTSYMSIGGQVSQGPMPGTIKVNSDCTGTVDWGSGVNGNVVVLDGGARMNSMMIAGGPMGSPIISGQWKRISRIPNTVEPNQCSGKELVGVYAIRQQGFMVMTLPDGSQAPAPVAMLAMGSVGYDGSGPAHGVASLGGQTIRFEVPSTTFTVGTDCTVNTTAEFASQGVTLGPTAGWGIILDGGDEGWTIETQDPTGGPVILGTWKRISPMPWEAASSSLKARSSR